MVRESDLIDVWFDSGAMPYAQVHYPFEIGDAEFRKVYPADYVAEGVDQTRGWFFTLHAIASMLFDSVAFKNIISNGLVPATTANFGAGFDSLGAALDYYNCIWMEEWDGCWIEILDDTDVPTDETNLIYQTAKALYERCGRPFRGLHIRQENRIPTARGLGSSSACIAGGLLGANELLGPGP